MSTAPEQLRVEANGLSVAALAWGDPDAPLALLVHGYPDTAWTWRHLGPALAAAGWRAVAPFSRGYAPTDLAPDDAYRVADLADDVLALHAALGGDERAVLVGHDWGAFTTWAVADVAPETFARYVCLAVPPPVTVLGPFTRLRTLGLVARQLRMSWYMAYQQLPGTERTLDRLLPRLWRDWSPGYDSQRDVTLVLESLADPDRARAALQYYRQNLRGGLPALVRIRPCAPALYLHGADDGCMTVRTIESFGDTLPAGSRVEVVDGAGHFLQLEAPDRVNAIVLDWLGRGS